MKKVQITNKKLQLNKSKVASLNNNQMHAITGGGDDVLVDGGDARIQILSIGHQCSLDHSCARLSNAGKCTCCNQPSYAVVTDGSAIG